MYDIDRGYLYNPLLFLKREQFRRSKAFNDVQLHRISYSETVAAEVRRFPPRFDVVTGGYAVLLRRIYYAVTMLRCTWTGFRKARCRTEIFKHRKDDGSA